ncbi:MAG: hypothetical protein ACK46A_06500, partial [Akkermansiaceae bacterium]
GDDFGMRKWRDGTCVTQVIYEEGEGFRNKTIKTAVGFKFSPRRRRGHRGTRREDVIGIFSLLCYDYVFDMGGIID